MKKEVKTRNIKVKSKNEINEDTSDIENACEHVEDTCKHVEDACEHVEDACEHVENEDIASETSGNARNAEMNIDVSTVTILINSDLNFNIYEILTFIISIRNRVKEFDYSDLNILNKNMVNKTISIFESGDVKDIHPGVLTYFRYNNKTLGVKIRKQNRKKLSTLFRNQLSIDIILPNYGEDKVRKGNLMQFNNGVIKLTGCKNENDAIFILFIFYDYFKLLCNFIKNSNIMKNEVINPENKDYEIYNILNNQSFKNSKSNYKSQKKLQNKPQNDNARISNMNYISTIIKNSDIPINFKIYSVMINLTSTMPFIINKKKLNNFFNRLYKNEKHVCFYEPTLAQYVTLNIIKNRKYKYFLNLKLHNDKIQISSEKVKVYGKDSNTKSTFMFFNNRIIISTIDKSTCIPIINEIFNIIDLNKDQFTIKKSCQRAKTVTT